MDTASPLKTQDPSADERLGLDPSSELWGEHRSRYRFAAVHAIGRRVLDAACGSGFGCQMLKAAGARQVVGVDRSIEALRSARAAFGTSAEFIQADLGNLPFPARAFELVVSTETIEHVLKPQRVLAEFARCLAPDGMLILSTPNRLFRPSPNGRPTNPYHVREYEPDELAALLSPWFEVRLFGQMVDPFYSAVPFLLKPEQGRLRSWQALRLIPWKLANRLPYPVKDELSWRLYGRAFYPTEYDYSFDPQAVEAAHDIVAIATLRRE